MDFDQDAYFQIYEFEQPNFCLVKTTLANEQVYLRYDLFDNSELSSTDSEFISLMESKGYRWISKEEEDSLRTEYQKEIGAPDNLYDYHEINWINIESGESLFSEEEIARQKEEMRIHRYELIVKDITWEDAYKDCMDRGGQLVHINTKNEYDCIVKQIEKENKQDIKFWLGAQRNEENGYVYYWVSGSDYVIGNEALEIMRKYNQYWLDGEPSCFSGDPDNRIEEDKVCMFFSKEKNRWFWNDVPNDITGYYGGKIGYICEYEK